MKFVSVVVTFNRKEKLIEAINCLINQTQKPNKIIIVDNHSTDGTTELLNKEGLLDNELIDYHVLPENIGGAGGYSKGIQFANEEGYNWLSLSDDDSMFQPDFVEKIITASKENPEIGCFTGTVQYEDGEIQELHRRKVSDWSIAKMKFVPTSSYSDNFETDIFSFVGCVIKKDIIEKIGLPRQDFFIWYDDIEYSLRIRKYSKILNISDARVVHKTPNIKPNSKEVKRDWRNYYGIRNGIITRAMYAENPLKFKLFIILGFLKRCFRILAPRYNGNRWYFFSYYCRAYWDGLMNKAGKNDKYLP